MKRRNGQNWLTQTNTNALILFSSKIKWDGVGNSQQGEAKKQKKLNKKKAKWNGANGAAGNYIFMLKGYTEASESLLQHYINSATHHFAALT